MSQFASLHEFYPYYLSEHGNRTCRRLHFVGSSLVLGCSPRSLPKRPLRLSQKCEN